MRAYETLKDPAERRSYNVAWPGIHSRRAAERQQEEAAETERRRATEVEKQRAKEDQARKERLRKLTLERCTHANQIFEVKRVLRKLRADLQRLRAEDEEYAKREREKKSWWSFVKSPVYESTAETEEEMEEKERRRIDRIASTRVKESELGVQETELNMLNLRLSETDSRIVVEASREKQATRNRLEQEQEARRRAEEKRTRDKWDATAGDRAKAEKEAAEGQAKEARETQERLRKEREEQRRRAERAARMAEAAKDEERRRMTAEANRRKEAQGHARRPQRDPLDRFASAEPSEPSAGCRHSGWWIKIEGQHRCSECNIVQKRFAYRCPSPACDKIACADCRRKIQGR